MWRGLSAKPFVYVIGDWSEDLQTVSLITRDHGLVRCLAKGSKREKAPFSGGLEIATVGHMVSIVRPNSELVLLTSWDLLDPVYLLRSDLDRYHAAMYAIDLIPRLINDHDPHPELYDAIREVLRLLGSRIECDEGQIASLLVWYQWVLLGSIGSAPELRADVEDGAVLDPGRDVYGFDAHRGGFTQDPGSSGHGDIWRVSIRDLWSCCVGSTRAGRWNRSLKRVCRRRSGVVRCLRCISGPWWGMRSDRPIRFFRRRAPVSESAVWDSINSARYFVDIDARGGLRRILGRSKHVIRRHDCFADMDTQLLDDILSCPTLPVVAIGCDSRA